MSIPPPERVGSAEDGRDATAGPAPQPEVLLAWSTAPDEPTAAAIARALVAARAAACVNIVPGLRSVYRWQGRIEEAAEWLLLIKTTADRRDALQQAVRAAHPYELPELVFVRVADGLPAYLQWVVDETRP